MRRRAALVVLAVSAALLAVALPARADAARGLLKGIYDDAQVISSPEATFPKLQALGVQVLRVTLRWNEVAAAGRPGRADDPADPAYQWGTYDRIVGQAHAHGIRVVFTILGVPAWANGGKKPNVVPTKPTQLERFRVDLFRFALAAGRRYSGAYQTADYAQLPRVDRWTAWNEPNDPTFLQPQYVRRAGAYFPMGGLVYAGMCTAIHDALHTAAREYGFETLVACGVTNPGGNNRGSAGADASISPIPFVQWMKRGGARFDVYAHHPYAGSAFETPTSGSGVRTRIGFGDLPKLIRELDRLWPKKKHRVWLTEYGYQTNPPDGVFGVKPKTQARYLKEAFAIAKANPRIDMFVNFILRDEVGSGASGTGGWQSGLEFANGKRKPSYAAFRRLAG